MKLKNPLRVFFNASVILSGLNSSTGGSAKLLLSVSTKEIRGIISEIVYDEVLKHSRKIGKNEVDIKEFITKSKFQIISAPKKEKVYRYQNQVSNLGDAHLFASSIESKSDYLVSLDKKHVLSLRGKIRKIKIVNPKELIEEII